MKPPLRVDLVVLNEIARIATQDLELQPMLQRITDTLAYTFDWQFVALISIGDDRKSFVCEAVTSFVRDVETGAFPDTDHSYS